MYQEDLVSHLQNCYLISPPWGNNPLPKYQVGQFLRSPYAQKPLRCIGVYWLKDEWYYSFSDNCYPERILSSARDRLFLPKIPCRFAIASHVQVPMLLIPKTKIPCRFAIASHVQVPMLLIPKTLVVGVRLRREWWGLDWVASVQTRRGNVTLSQKDLEAIA